MRIPLRGARLTLAAVLAAGLVAAGHAAAKAGSAATATTSATARPTVRITPLEVRRGGRILVTGRDWARNAIVDLLIGPPRSEADPVGRARTTSGGSFRRHLRIAAKTKPGRRVLLGCRRECRVKAVKSFRVTR